MYLECDDCEENCKYCPHICYEDIEDEDNEYNDDDEEYSYQEYLQDRADDEYHRMKDEGEI